MPKFATDPPVSEKQRRAMFAAAKGRSTLGIPKSVGKEFVGKDAKGAGAGTVHMTPHGQILFLKRAGDGDHKGEWCLPGGGVEGDEAFDQTAKRENHEEIGEHPAHGELELLDRNVSDEGVDFVTFLNRVSAPFVPRLNGEHSDFRWKSAAEAPTPLHPGVKRTLQKRMGMDAVILAFDRSSLRTYDHDGRLRVAISNISKATVNPYLGHEIPGWQMLGLNPTRIYKLLRDPEELRKAVPTFNNIPLLSKHVPMTAADHKPELVVGSTGTDAVFEFPYLKNSLVVWTEPAIDGIEDEDKTELSCAYRYRADMTPGTFEGQAYDGVMRDLKGNHVALVKKGRAGSDVIVGDSAIPSLKEAFAMTNKNPLSRKASVLKGALMHFLSPILAADAAIDLNPVLAGITQANFKTTRAGVLERLNTALKGKIAQDANLDQVTQLLDALEDCEEIEGADTNPETGEPAKPAGGEGEAEKFLKGKLSAEDFSAYDGMRKGGRALDETPEQKTEREKKEADEKAAKDAAMKDMVSKPAMDAAIADATVKTKTEVIAAQRAIREAEKTVRPWVGELAIACDSADAVYEHALKALNVDIKGVHPSAYPAVLKAQPKPGDSKKQTMAMDAASAKSFADRFPSAGRIGTA
jgi:8-oxo-dGTP pyrophosphatase MutT (NUDIX family)